MLEMSKGLTKFAIVKPSVTDGLIIKGYGIVKL